MVKISKFGEDFLLLALRIDKHINGYIDFYIGPEKLKHIVENEPLTAPKKLLDDCKNLKQQSFYQGFNKEREKYLMKLLIAMETSIKIINDTNIPIEEQFLKIYDVALKPVNESLFKNLVDEFDRAYPGSGSLEERMKNYSIRRKVPKRKVFEFFTEALDVVRKQTKELFLDILPEEEKIIIELVDNNKSSEKIKWSCYNWYLGNYTSKIEVNFAF